MVMAVSIKSIGWLLISFSLVLLVLLTFVKTDFDTQSAVLCQKFEETKQDMKDCPAHKSNFSWIIIVSFGVGFLLFGIGLYLVLSHKSEVQGHTKEFKKLDISKLDDEEKSVYSLLLAKNGSLYQTELVKETGFGKVKITRVLDKLESKDVLERKRRGMTNIIVLK